MVDDNEVMVFFVFIILWFENIFSCLEVYFKFFIFFEKENFVVVKEIFDFCKKDELNGS